MSDAPDTGTATPPQGGWPNNLLPSWVDAADAFMREAFPPGHTVPHQWFYDALGITCPRPDMRADESEKLRFTFLDQFTRMREHLLITHNVALRSAPGVGYQRVKPGEQAILAKRKLDDDLSASFKRATMWSTFVDTGQLTPAERSEQHHVQATIAAMQGHITAARAAMKRRASAFNGKTTDADD